MTRTSLSKRAEGYGVPSAEVDGNDVEAVHAVTAAAVAQARAGGGPTFIEAHTYRLLGHMIGDSEVYRTREEVAFWRDQRDPIKLTRARLLASGVEDAVLRDTEASVTAELDEIEAFAKRAHSPTPKRYGMMCGPRERAIGYNVINAVGRPLWSPTLKSLRANQCQPMIPADNDMRCAL